MDSIVKGIISFYSNVLRKFSAYVFKFQLIVPKALTTPEHRVMIATCEREAIFLFYFEELEVFQDYSNFPAETCLKYNEHFLKFFGLKIGHKWYLFEIIYMGLFSFREKKHFNVVSLIYNQN